MASNPYEVEHNIKTSAARRHTRRPDMSTFTSHLHGITNELAAAQGPAHLGPTPVDAAALFSLVQDQFLTLASDAPDSDNLNFLQGLVEQLRSDIDNPPDHISGVSQEYLDTLDRVPRKKLKADDSCPICAEKYLDDKYCLVVELPCHGSHCFDLECVGPWLQSKGTCPMCRKDLTKKKEIPKPKEDEEEEEDIDGLYG